MTIHAFVDGLRRPALPLENFPALENSEDRPLFHRTADRESRENPNEIL
jgi:hypothetical protein